MNAEHDQSIDVKQALEFAKKANASNNTTTEQPSTNAKKTLDEYKHGEIIVDESGVAGIVVDRDHKLKKIAENEVTLNTLKALSDERDTLFNSIDIKHRERKEGEPHPADDYIRNNPDSEAALKLSQVRDAFAGFAPTFDGQLAPKDDPRAKLYKEAMDKLRSGEVKLPTVSEYEQQLKEREERQKKGIVLTKQKLINSNTETNSQVETTPVQEEVSDIEEIDSGVELIQEDMEMTEEQNKEIIQSAGLDPIVEAMNSKKEEPAKTEASKSAAKPTAPLDLVAMEEAMMTQEPGEESAPVKTEVAEEENGLTIEVPESKAEAFMTNMPTAIKDKVETSKVVKVKFVGEVELPKATKRLTSIDGYRRVAPKNVSAELVSRVLINSGYIGYFKACGALKWSSLSPVVTEDGDLGDMDLAKVAQFCYEQLVTTSIGKMTYRQFLEQTSDSDMQAILHAIMAASLPDTQDIVMGCGRRACQKEFGAQYSISELPDYDKLEDETKEQISKIIAAKDIVEESQDVHNESPVMKKVPFTAKDTGTIFVFKHRDLATIIDRTPSMEEVAERYGESAAILNQFVSEVYIPNPKEDDDFYMSNDPRVICEELYRLKSDTLEEIKAVISEIPSIPSLEYSMKGKFVCEHCGSETIDPSQDITSLVFQVALKARYYV